MSQVGNQSQADLFDISGNSSGKEVSSTQGQEKSQEENNCEKTSADPDSQKESSECEGCIAAGNLKTEIEQLLREKAKFEKCESNLKAEIESLKTSVEEHEVRFEQVQFEMNNSQKQLDSLRGQEDQRTAELEMMKSEVSEKENLCERLQCELKVTEKQWKLELDNLKSEASVKETLHASEKKDLQAVCSEQERELGECADKIAELGAEIDSFKTEIGDKQNRLDELNVEVLKLKAEKNGILTPSCLTPVKRNQSSNATCIGDIVNQIEHKLEGKKENKTNSLKYGIKALSCSVVTDLLS